MDLRREMCTIPLMEAHPNDKIRPSMILPRRSILRGAAFTATGLVAGTVASACAGARPSWTMGPVPSGVAAAAASPAPSSAHAGMGTASPGASAAPDMDAEAEAVVKRFLGGEWQQVPGFGNQPIQPTVDGDTKVF